MSTRNDRDVRGAAVQVHIRDQHASVPVRLMEKECGLSPGARLALLYMLDLGRRPGWTIYATQVQRALGYGNSRWPRCRRELEAAGYLRAICGHDEAGDWQWTYHIFDWPVDGPDDAVSVTAVCGDANCGDANCGDRRISTSHSSTSLKKQKQKQARPRAREVEPVAPPAGNAAAAREEKRQQRVVHGVTCWTPDDLAATEELTSAHGAQAVRAAAAALRKAGSDPLPSKVALALQDAARRDAALAVEQEAAAQEVARLARRKADERRRDERRADSRTQAAARAALAAVLGPRGG